MAIDIDQSFYKTGTATVANGSTVVTGQGTLWTQTCRAGDLFGTHVGDGTRILSVNSNTSLTLAYPWQGASQTASAYEIQFTPYDVGYQASVRELLLTMASGNVDALAGLTGANNTMPYFTGVGTMGRTDLTAWARTLLAATSGAGGYTALGVIPNSQLPSRIGEIATAVPAAANYLDSISVTGWVRVQTVDAALVNAPSGASGGFVFTGIFSVSASTGNITQTYYNIASRNRTWTRFRSGAGWSPWSEVYTSSSILGTVSQSSGVPTGAIVERGSNANGEFVRWADGTMICTRTIIISGDTWKTSGSSVLFPSDFAVIPVIQLTSNSPSFGYASIAEARFTSTSSFLLVGTGVSDTGTSASFGVMAIGRWF